MTFGGMWNGVGPKFDINSWVVSPQLVPSSVSKNAQRISHRIWNSLTTKGTCIARVPSTQPPTSKPTMDRTFFSATAEDGRIWYQPNRRCMETSTCATAPGVMFDMVFQEQSHWDGVLVESLQFEHIPRNITVDVFTMEGSSRDGDQASRPWTKVGSITVNPRNSISKVDLNSPVSISSGNKRGFYLTNRNTDSFFLVGPSDSSALPSYDSNGVAMQNGAVRFGAFGVKVPGYNPDVQAGYSMLLPPTRTEKTLQSMDTYTLGPDYLCKDDCFAAPGFMFNVRNTNAAASEIIITRISFEHLAPQQQRAVDLYRIIGSSYSGNVQNPSKWVKIATTHVPQMNFNTMEFMLPTPITLIRGEIVAFYIKTEENVLLVRQKREDENLTANNVQLLYGSSIMNSSFGIPVSGYSWNGAVTFTAALG